jgi:hypothetical protein
MSDRRHEIKGEQLCYFYQKLTERFPLVSLMGPFDGRDWENHSRLSNICDIQIAASDLITPVPALHPSKCALPVVPLHLNPADVLPAAVEHSVIRGPGVGGGGISRRAGGAAVAAG